MFEEGKSRGRKSADGGRSISTANLKEDEEEAVERERTRRRVKSTLDLRADEEGAEEDHAESRLKSFINFFRNLRPPKEKQADQVISLVPEEECEKKRNGRTKEKAAEKDEKATISERYRNWRERRAKSKRPDEEEEEKTSKKKKTREKRETANGLSDDDSESEVQQRRKKKKRQKSPVQCDSSDLSDGDLKTNGHLRNSSMHLGSISDLSIDNLELPQEYSNRDLDHRIQTVKPSARKSKKPLDAFDLEDSELDSGRLSKPRNRASAFEFDLDGDNGSDLGSAGRLSTLNRLRQRLHRKNKETVLESFNAEGDNKSKKGKKQRQKASEEEDAVSIRTDRSVKSSVSKSSKTKKKKKKGKKEAEDSDLPSGDSDPEVIVEESTRVEQEMGRKEAPKARRPSQNFHVTYLSSDTDEDSVIVVDRRKQNFFDERKRRFRFPRMGRKEKVDSGTRITPLTEGTSQHYCLDLPMLPDEPWDPVEYDPELHDESDTDDDFIDLQRLQNLLGDPTEKLNVVVIDTRNYNDFLESRLIFAQHIDEFLNAEAEILTDQCDQYSFFVLYDNNGRTLSLMDSPLSKMYDFLKSGSKSWCLFIIDGGFDRVRATAPHLICKSTKTARRYDLCPSVCDDKVLWGNFDDFNITHVVKRFGISHIVTFEADVAAKVPFNVESLLLKLEPDSMKLFDHFEALFKFLLLGKSEEKPPLKLLLTCTAADNRCSAAVIAYMMFRHHWSLQDAFTHVTTRRKSVQLGKNNLKALQKLEKRLFGKLMTKSMPKLKLVKKKEEEDDEKAEEKASDADSSVSGKKMEKKKKKKKKKRKSTKEDSDSELQFSDDDKRKKTKKEKKRETSVPEPPATPEIPPRRLHFGKKREPRKEKEKQNEEEEEETKDAEAPVSGRKVKKKTRKKGKSAKEDGSDSELQLSDDEKSKITKKEGEPPTTPEIPPRSFPFGKKRDVRKEKENDEKEEGEERKKERRPSRTKGRRKSTAQPEEENQVQSFALSPEQDSREEKEEEEEVAWKPRPKKRFGLMRLKKNTMEGLEASAHSVAL